MAGVIIYKSTFNQYYSFIFADHSIYRAAKRDIRKNGDEILWKKRDVNPEQLQNIREKKDKLVKRLNEGEKVDLKKELDSFFE